MTNVYHLNSIYGTFKEKSHAYLSPNGGNCWELLPVYCILNYKKNDIRGVFWSFKI